MARTHKTVNETIALSARWQSLFIAAVVVAWLSELAAMLLRNLSDYTSDGTWAFQISTLLLPLTFFVAAFLLLGHYKHPIRRLFMTCLAAVIGMIFYTVFASWVLQVWMNAYVYYHPIGAGDTSWWSAFGIDWTVMLVSLVAFTAGLYVATRRLRR